MKIIRHKNFYGIFSKNLPTIFMQSKYDGEEIKPLIFQTYEMAENNLPKDKSAVINKCDVIQYVDK